MKQHYAKIILFCLCCLVGAKAKAIHNFEVGGIFYKYNSDGTSVFVTYKGYSSSSYENEYTGEVTIPESVTYNSKTYSVTYIDGEAFRGCSGLTSVTIPNSVTSIGGGAFLGCSGLTSVTIPNSVTSIGYHAFYGCSGLTSVTIPNSVTSIGSSAFYGCSSLTSVNIPNSVTRIGDEAFSGCSSLTSVTIPNSVTSIGGCAFMGCSGLTSVTIPNSVTSIGYYAFSGCSGLTLVTIPNSVTSINWNAFDGCSSLTSVTIPNSVTSIGDNAFSGCSGLTSVSIGNGVTSIGERAFYECSGLTSIKVEEGNKTYDSRDNCNAIIKTETNELLVGCMNTIIPNSVTRIGREAFFCCSALTSVTIPNSVTSIGKQAFSGCSGLTSVTIGNSVTSIENSAFEGCSSLKKVTINSNAIVSKSYYSSPVLGNFGSQVEECVLGDNVTSIGERIFESCSGLTSVTIGNSVTSIGNEAFSRCSSLTTITIPNSVTSIGEGAFRGCSGLTSLTIPNSVTSIGTEAFYGCSNIKKVTINSNAITSKTYSSSSSLKNIFGTQVEEYVLGNDVTNIGPYAFYDYTSLTSLTIPNSVTSIGTEAFYCCSGLTTIKVDEANPIYDSRDNCNAIIETKTNKLVIGCKNTVIPNSVTSIDSYVFGGCSGLTSVTIPNSVTSIGSEAFRGCSGLTSVTIPNSVTSIGKLAFEGCSGLTSVTIGNSVTSIGDEAFGNKVHIYVNRGTTSLLALWKADYIPYELGKTNVKLSPSYLTLESSTQTTLTVKVNNMYKEFNYSIGGKSLQSNILQIKDLCPKLYEYMTLRISLSYVAYEKESGFYTKELNPKVNFTSTASSITFNGTFDEGDATIKTYVLEANGKRIEVDGKNISSKGKSFTITGLDPQTTYKGKLTLTVSYGEGNKNTKSFEASSEGKTQQLKLSTQQPKVISVGNVIVAAETNLDEEETNAGFEWRRTDWTDNFASNTGGAYIYEGTMEGYIRNLNTEKLWKVRPYYESNSGKRYYGEWMGLDPTNTSYFEPTVHTYAKIDVQNNTASVKGYAMRGSDNVASQGFKYWKSAAGARAQGGSKVSVPADAKTVEASGQVMTAELTGLDYESSYSYVAFMTTTEGQTFYGEVQSFQTGVGTSGIDSPTTAEEAYEVARYDVKGRRISTPQRGLNILRLSDGSVRKVMVK